MLFALTNLSKSLSLSLPFSLPLTTLLLCFACHKTFKLSKMSKGHPSFSIVHFAGKVEYNATNLLEKNRDNMASDIVAVLMVCCRVLSVCSSPRIGQSTLPL